MILEALYRTYASRDSTADLTSSSQDIDQYRNPRYMQQYKTCRVARLSAEHPTEIGTSDIIYYTKYIDEYENNFECDVV